MESRNVRVLRGDGSQGHLEGSNSIRIRSPGPMPFLPGSLEEKLETQLREMLSIITQNGGLIDDNVILQRELAAAKEDIHRLGQLIPELHAERDKLMMRLIERNRELEASLFDCKSLRDEVIDLGAEYQQLNALRQELTHKVLGLTQEKNDLQAENQQLLVMKADIDQIRRELIEARRAYDFERQANEEQLARKQALEQRTRGLGGGRYTETNVTPDFKMRYHRTAVSDRHDNDLGPFNKRVRR